MGTSAIEDECLISVKDGPFEEPWVPKKCPRWMEYIVLYQDFKPPMEHWFRQTQKAKQDIYYEEETIPVPWWGLLGVAAFLAFIVYCAWRTVTG